MTESNLQGILIRSENTTDREAIRRIHIAAFPTPGEANLVETLREAEKSALSLVAETAGIVVGHILFSPVTLAGTPRGLGLAPVAVLPEYHRQGIGSRLITEGLAICKRQGVPFVVVLGEPEYYSRFGFRTASAWKLGNEYGVDEPFMVVELQEDGIPGRGGMVRYAEEFGQL